MENVVRRGRPPKSEELAEAIIETNEQTDAAPSKRRRRASVGGHALKLQAPVRAGYTRRWMNDLNNRIAEADDLAYDFVFEKGIKTDDPSSRVSRIVGTKANGEPLKAYLMETPNELYAEGVSEKEAQNARVEDDVREGRYSEGHGGDNTFGSGSITRSSG